MARSMLNHVIRRILVVGDSVVVVPVGAVVVHVMCTSSATARGYNRRVARCDAGAVMVEFTSTSARCDAGAVLDEFTFTNSATARGYNGGIGSCDAGAATTTLAHCMGLVGVALGMTRTDLATLVHCIGLVGVALGTTRTALAALMDGLGIGAEGWLAGAALTTSAARIYWGARLFVA